jgi:hypothetical protein
MAAMLSSAVIYRWLSNVFSFKSKRKTISPAVLAHEKRTKTPTTFFVTVGDDP